jgi:hypothetical protein
MNITYLYCQIELPQNLSYEVNLDNIFVCIEQIYSNND